MISEVEISSDELSANRAKNLYKCPYDKCTAAFSKNSKYQYHIRRHTGERPFACDEPNCNKAYFYSFHLRRHKETHTNKVKHEGLVCPVEGCYLELANKYSLKKHIKRKHNPDRTFPFTCETCNQGFHRKKHLLHHVYIHTGIPSFECPICGIKLGIIRDLNRHKRTHMKYSCDCGEKFVRWTVLLAHKKECQSAWHMCDICEKRFKQKTNLNSHLLTHVQPDEKFTCGYEDCGRSYLYKKNLIQHIRRYHQKIVKKIVCPMFGENCNKTFSKNQNLKYHMRRFHSNQTIQKKTVRKPRKDKGVSRTSMAAFLSGLCLSRKDQETVIKGLPIELPPLENKEKEQVSTTAENEENAKQNNNEKQSTSTKEKETLLTNNASQTNSEERPRSDQSKLILRGCGSESDVCEDSEPDFVKVVC